jgi:hypothetical protein
VEQVLGNLLDLAVVAKKEGETLLNLFLASTALDAGKGFFPESKTTAYQGVLG